MGWRGDGEEVQLSLVNPALSIVREALLQLWSVTIPNRQIIIVLVINNNHSYTNDDYVVSLWGWDTHLWLEINQMY